MKKDHATRLGTVLIRKGYLKESDLIAVLSEQRSDDRILGKLLLDRGLIHEEALARALAELYTAAFVHLDKSQIDWSVVDAHSPTWIKDYGCVAFAEDKRQLSIAIADPLKAEWMSQIEREAGRHVKWVVVTQSDIAHMNHVYRERIKRRRRDAFRS